MEFEISKDNPSIIKVVGVGGGGCNAVNHMFRQGIKGVDFIVCNTDQQALDMSPVTTKVQLGNSLTQGLGAGSIPEVGKNSAIETAEEIRKILEKGTKMVFITAGMGGGTGTGAAPVIAGIAKELGILTVGIVTLPFSFEGRKREQQAREGLELLKKNVDTLLVIKNDKLREIHGNLKLNEAFAQADSVLTTAAKSIAEIITKTLYMNVDFADVFTVLNNSGAAIMGSAIAEGPDRAIMAVRNALESPLLNDNNIEGARYVLLNIVSGTGEHEVTMDEFEEITNYVQQMAGNSAELKNGTGFDDQLGSKIHITIIATGFKTGGEINSEPKAPERIVRELTASVPEPPKVEETIIAPVAEIQADGPVASAEIVNQEEMTLIVKPTEEVQRSFEFEIAKTEAEQEPLLKVAEMTAPAEVIASEKTGDDFSEQLKRSKERILRLKEISLKIKSPGGLTELEKVPAYVRRNVDLEKDAPSHSSPELSRYTLSDNDGKPEIRPNNSFLHDNVD